ncbi:MAG: hypothetical protein HOQ03_02110 [Thermoleophilia bacterium]|nr:hypothetical protein [Thermoleophilia bacterium]
MRSHAAGSGSSSTNTANGGSPARTGEARKTAARTLLAPSRPVTETVEAGAVPQTTSA